MQLRVKGLRAIYCGMALCAAVTISAPVSARDSALTTLSAQVLDHRAGSMAFSAPSEVQGWAKLSSRSRLAPMVALLGSGSACTLMTYDANGNRLAQTVTTIGTTGATWGAGLFGCFVWHS